MTDHLPPHDLEAEQSALGAMLASTQAVPVVAGMLREDDFYRDSHRRIFAAVLKVQASGAEPDTVSVSALLPADREFIHTLAECVPAASNAAHYAAIVRDKSVLRAIIRTGHEIAELGYQGKDSGHALIDECETKMLGVLQRRRDAETSHIIGSEEAFAIFGADLDRRKRGEVVGLPWPAEWSTLGKRVGPLEPGSLTIVAARPSTGKTLWGLQLMRSLCSRGHCVLFVSRELTVTRLMRRQISSFGASLRNLQTGKLVDSDTRALDKYLDTARGWHAMYDDHARTIADIRREVEINKPELVIIDYLQRLAYDTEKEYAALTRIVNELQDLTLATNIPVVCLSQLSRPMKGTETKAPTMSDVRGSGAVEERAANLIILHREWETDKEERYGKMVDVAKSPKETGWMICAKVADGETGKPIPAWFDGARMRITERA
jgi:replicative DNA helicase